ncbi:basic amino acid/polyamine antiporter, APA family [Dyella sp. OK004]|uniref:amino acid permease n=1 Tax=Dyella sp. OK004 TaxID=1855292 RepID=UPI0008E290A3|nr:amino acid permease [Dyella sp. OK004]SFS14951.1 basic amino acid/polyamine antiporter, APA family [Dyella sp. OK004]
MLKNLFATTSISASPNAGELPDVGAHGEATLKRALTARHLVMLGIGAIIGAGIFVITGQAAAQHAGPAIVLSFVLAGFACALAALCYAEFAAMLPVSGSAYSYSYATLGEYVAWFVGWSLVLEYLFTVATVAAGWSGYFNKLLSLISGWVGHDVSLPQVLASAPFTVVDGHIQATGMLINLPAVAIIAAITGLCYVGITQSAFVNSIIVAIKVTVILLFIAFAAKYVNPDNWHPFIPANEGASKYGWSGVGRAAAIVFFSYIGFDAVSTAAAEAKNPQRDMPIGILGSLVVCTILYIIVAGILTGIADFRLLGTPEPVATALDNYPTLHWLQIIVVIGAVTGLSSVILVMLMGQPRIFYSMARDGLIPAVFGRIHKKFRTPHVGTVVVGVLAALLGGMFNIGVLGEMVAMGTLLAFATVCIGVLVLRYTRPELPRAFRVPVPWLVCPLGALACMALFLQSFVEHWRWMLAWIAIGQVIYFFYGYSHSKLRKPAA